MASGQDEGPDISSIAPVSSLRSKFESLEQPRPVSRSVSPSPIPPKPSFLKAGLASYSGPHRDTNHGSSSDMTTTKPSGQAREEPLPRRKARTPPQSRPQSMSFPTPSNPLPKVNVDPPGTPPTFSPHKSISVDLRISAHGSKSPSFVSAKPIVQSPATMQPLDIKRAASPNPSSTMPPLFRAKTAPKAHSDGVVTKPHTPDLSPNTSAVQLPPVNRAGKPNVPKKPAALLEKATTLAAPRPAPAELTDHSVSPFSTPPSSGASTPDRRTSSPAPPRRYRPVSRETVNRLRGESDASFVEHLPSDSGASPDGKSRGFHDTSPPEFEPPMRRQTSEDRVPPLPGHHGQWALPPPVHNRHNLLSDNGRDGVSRAQQPQWLSNMKGLNLPSRSPEQKPPLPSRPSGVNETVRRSPNLSEQSRPDHTDNLALRRSATIDASTPRRVPANNFPQRSALLQGFDHTASAALSPASSHNRAPAVPAARRSLDRRREAVPPEPAYVPVEDDIPDIAPLDMVAPESSSTASASDFPDPSQASRRPPSYRQRPYYIHTESDTRTFAVCGKYVCTTGHQTKAWDLRTGELLMHMPHDETIKMTAIVFKPSATVDDEGKRVWLGSNTGDLYEVDIPLQAIVKRKHGAHPRREVIRMFRHASQLWTLDDGGDLNVWKPDGSGIVSLDSRCFSFRTPRGHTFSIAIGSHLWLATGKRIWVLSPGAESDTNFNVLRNALIQDGTGDIFSGATLASEPELVYFGHQDGKVSIYNRRNFTCTGIVNVSVYRLSSLTGVGDYLWAGYHTGVVCVYDTSCTPWRVKKEWRAHDKYVCGIVADRSALWKLDRLHVVTLGIDNLLRIWDGTLEADWLDARMKELDGGYCSFRELTAAVLTWNAGASKPHYLQQDMDDSSFFREYTTSGEPPDIFVFGFQELVDLEDKKATAKAFFKSRRKDAADPEHIGHQYRAWRDYLTRCLDDSMPSSETYTLLHAASLVGLFTCIFVKSRIRNLIKHVHAAEVKRGLGGHHGNKGALVLRVVLEDSSVCFINCHLAAGQTQTTSRNHDIAEILEAEVLPAHPLAKDGAAQHSDVFASGGDGSMILDHEICILNGDLNYRIDTMGRDTVIKHVAQNNLTRLLERDQLLLSRRKNAGNRLRAFQESEITFAPTYKYDVRSDRYDTSEKRRAPAWCDRILYRGLGKVKMEEYRRWEVRVSDHRPVSGRLRLRVKKVDPTRRAGVWERAQQEFGQVRKRITMAVQIEYLTTVLGLTQKEAAAALRS